MGEEDERKFLLASDAWRSQVAAESEIVQGYLCLRQDLEVRVRLKSGKGRITVKGKRAGTKRPEYEADLTRDDAQRMLDRECLYTLVTKVRHEIKRDGLTWEIDVYKAENDGLVLAELELREGQVWPTGWPDWIGAEVTQDDRYYNRSLVQNPYSTWGTPAAQ